MKGLKIIEISCDKMKEQIGKIEEGIHIVLVMAMQIEEMIKRKDMKEEVAVYKRAMELLKNRNHVSMLENGVKELIK